METKTIKSLVGEYAKPLEGKDGELADAVVAIAETEGVAINLANGANLISKRKAFARDFTILSAQKQN